MSEIQAVEPVVVKLRDIAAATGFIEHGKIVKPPVVSDHGTSDAVLRQVPECVPAGNQAGAQIRGCSVRRCVRNGSRVGSCAKELAAY